MAKLSLAAGVVLGAGVAIATHFARLVLTPAALPESGVELLSVDVAGEIGAQREHDRANAGDIVWLRGPDAQLPGSYSFIFDVASRSRQREAGHARLGPVREVIGSGTQARVARPVLSVERGALRVGAKGRITGWWYSDPTQLGYPVQQVALPLPHGVGMAWVIRPERPVAGRWAIHVHGRGALPEETLRGVAPFAEEGVTSLVISYRNDPDAPRGLRGRYGLGLAEQDDVAAALGWVRTQGAERVTLVGWSMGATAVLLTAEQARDRALVDAIVLDSPALDWSDILRHQARMSHLPGLVTRMAALQLQLGAVRGAVPGARGTDLASLSPDRFASRLRVPVLLHASAGDSYVPWGGALRLAQLRPSLVRLRPAQGEHVKLWNVNPEEWELETRQFIAAL